MFSLYRLIKLYYAGYNFNISYADNSTISDIEYFVEQELKLPQANEKTIALIREIDQSICKALRAQKRNNNLGATYVREIMHREHWWRNNPIARCYFEYKLQNKYVFYVSFTGELQKISRKLSGPDLSVIYVGDKDSNSKRKKIILSRNKLGQGGFGVVKQGTAYNQQASQAIKIRDLDDYDFQSAIESTKEEMDNNELMGNTVVSSIFSTCNNKHYMGMPLVPGINGIEAINQTINGSGIDTLQILVGMAEQIQAMHDLGYIHRDIKADNFVCQKITQKAENSQETTTYKCRLIDLQTMQHVGTDGVYLSTEDFGTPGYIAPDVYQTVNGKYKYTKKTDIYAFGITLTNCFYAVANSIWLKPQNNDEQAAVQIIDRARRAFAERTPAKRSLHLHQFISEGKRLIDIVKSRSLPEIATKNHKHALGR